MAKRARTGLRPEDLVQGALVIYHGDRRGVVRDAFAPLNQFWVADEKTNRLVRDEGGEITAFRAEELQLAERAPATQQQAKPSQEGRARVMLLGTESQMLQVLARFGEPDAWERNEPQQLLAVPCTSCRCSPSCARFDPRSRKMCTVDCPLLQLAVDGIDESLHDLASRLRPDIEVAVRAYHLKQAIERVGSGLLDLDGYYCLSAVSLPHGITEIAAAPKHERHWLQEVLCQIDLGVAAEAIVGPDELVEEAARRALRDQCNLHLADALWEEEVQLRVRQQLAPGAPIPLEVCDGLGTKVFVVLLPQEAVAGSWGDLLSFELPGAAGLAATPGARTSALRAGMTGADQQVSVGGKTIGEWKAEQEQFKDLPKLPAGWIRIKSRSTEGVYFYDTRTNKSTFDFPLPPGWTKQVSKTSGKTYYFNAKLRKSSYEIPTE